MIAARPSRRHATSLLFSTVAVLCLAPAVSHAFKCAAKIDTKTGNVLVSASGFNGAMTWSPSATGNTYPFANAAECSTTEYAKGCFLDVARPTIPPAGCVVHLSAGGETCAARIKGCTPGVRPLPNEGILLLRDGLREAGIFWGKRHLVVRGSALRTYADALRHRDLVNGESSDNPAVRANGIMAIDDWESPVAFHLREIAETLSDTVQAAPDLADEVAALWPVGEFWWSRTANSLVPGEQWGVVRRGAGRFALRSRDRDLTGHAPLLRHVNRSLLRSTPPLRGTNSCGCCSWDNVLLYCRRWC